MIRHEYGNPDARNVLIQLVDVHDMASMDAEIAALRAESPADFRLVALEVSHWNMDLSPWPAPPVFGKEGFGDGAAETLGEVLRCCGQNDKRYCIGGYSLAGLFALWAAYQTDVFAAVAAASPSVWFPGFLDYMKSRPIHCPNVYLSLGDREERTRNPVMATVSARIRESHAWLAGQAVDCALEWNAGNHFKDPELRMARAWAWVLNH